ncbi:MAG: hypothetical protein IK101_04310 [Oscillospiraceae bacterium]|nr:hypothetical protein [Oscillospiraceae bacterium]
MIFYIADTYFGDERAVVRYARPYADAAEAEEMLTEMWNCTVSANDEVYILGGMFGRRVGDPGRTLDALEGRKILVAGGAEIAWMKRRGALRYFDCIAQCAETADRGAEVVMRRRPPVAWKRGDGFAVHGTTHTDVGGRLLAYARDDRGVLNASVDVNGYRPVTFEEMLVNNELFREGLRIGECRVGA